MASAVDRESRRQSRRSLAQCERCGGRTAVILFGHWCCYALVAPGIRQGPYFTGQPGRKTEAPAWEKAAKRSVFCQASYGEPTPSQTNGHGRLWRRRRASNTRRARPGTKSPGEFFLPFRRTGLSGLGSRTVAERMKSGSQRGVLPVWRDATPLTMTRWASMRTNRTTVWPTLSWQLPGEEEAIDSVFKEETLPKWISTFVRNWFNVDSTLCQCVRRWISIAPLYSDLFGWHSWHTKDARANIRRWFNFVLKLGYVSDAGPIPRKHEPLNQCCFNVKTFLNIKTTLIQCLMFAGLLGECLVFACSCTTTLRPGRGFWSCPCTLLHPDKDVFFSP